MRRDTATISLHDGTLVTVDAENFEWLSQYKWSKSGGGYARTGANSRLMHRMITRAPKGMVTDHINGDIYDNRKSNLRVCTQRDNAKNHKSVHVFFDKRYGTWRATIRVDYEYLPLGSYASRTEALAAYRSAAAYHFGEFARVDAEPKSAQQLLWESRAARSQSYKGVRQFHHRFQARIQIDGKERHIGMYGTAEEAARAFDAAARKAGRPEWRMNFPGGLA